MWALQSNIVCRLYCQKALPRPHLHAKSLLKILRDVREGHGNLPQIRSGHVSCWLRRGLSKVSIAFFVLCVTLKLFPQHHYILWRTLADSGGMCTANARNCIPRNQINGQRRNCTQQGWFYYPYESWILTKRLLIQMLAKVCLIHSRSKAACNTWNLSRYAPIKSVVFFTSWGPVYNFYAE